MCMQVQARAVVLKSAHSVVLHKAYRAGASRGGRAGASGSAGGRARARAGAGRAGRAGARGSASAGTHRRAPSCRARAGADTRDKHRRAPARHQPRAAERQGGRALVRLRQKTVCMIVERPRGSCPVWAPGAHWGPGWSLGAPFISHRLFLGRHTDTSPQSPSPAPPESRPVLLCFASALWESRRRVTVSCWKRDLAARRCLTGHIQTARPFSRGQWAWRTARHSSGAASARPWRWALPCLRRATAG